MAQSSWIDWTEEETSHFVIDMDFTQNLWRIWKDDELILSTTLGGTSLRTVAFSLSRPLQGASEDSSVAVAVDNIKVYASDPIQAPPSPELPPDLPPLGPPPPAQGISLFDIDFGAPTHVTGTLPTTGTESDQVSEVSHGMPTVVSEDGQLNDQSLLFRGRASYEQIRLDVPPGWSKYRVEYDVLTKKLQGSNYVFSVSLDTPQIRQVNLHGGTQAVQNFPKPLHNIGAEWTEEQISHFVIEVDFIKNLWQIWKDDLPVLNTTLDAANLRSIRFNLSPWSEGAADALDVEVAVDNIKVIASEEIELVPPVSLSVARQDSANALALSWPSAPLAQTYRIYRSEIDDIAGATEVAETDQLSFVDPISVRGKTRYYWITSNRTGLPPSEPVSGSGALGFLPVEGLSVNRVSGTVALVWMASAEADHYRIMRSGNDRFPSAVEIARVSGQEFIDETAKGNASYHYWVIPGNSDVGVAPGRQGSGFAILAIQPLPPAGGGALPPAGSAPNETQSSGDGATVSPAMVTQSSSPDLWWEQGRNSTTGKGLTNKSGRGQHLKLSFPRGRVVKRTVGISEGSEAGGGVLLKGSRGNRHFRTSYRHGGNVTADVVAGTFEVVSESDHRRLDVVVSPTRSSRDTRNRRSLLTELIGTSTARQSARDRVVLQIQVGGHR